MANPTTHIRTSTDLHAQLKSVATREGRPMTEVIRRALALYVMAGK